MRKNSNVRTATWVCALLVCFPGRAASETGPQQGEPNSGCQHLASMLDAFAAIGEGWYRGPPDGARETMCTFEQGRVADAEGRLYALAGVHVQRDVDLPEGPVKCWLELEQNAADAAHAFIVDDTDYGVNPILFSECELKPNVRLVSSMVIARGGGSAVPGLKYFSVLARAEAVELWRREHPGEIVFADQALAEYLPRILERAESGASPQVDSQ